VRREAIACSTLCASHGAVVAARLYLWPVTIIFSSHKPLFLHVFWDVVCNKNYKSEKKFLTSKLKKFNVNVVKSYVSLVKCLESWRWDVGEDVARLYGAVLNYKAWGCV
jgi:hypothetical protein